MHHLIIDGMLSGTGIRDALNGGYLEPSAIGLSKTLRDRLEKWHSKYEEAHFSGYGDSVCIETLVREGFEIVELAKQELPKVVIEYYSDAKMQKMDPTKGQNP